MRASGALLALLTFVFVACIGDDPDSSSSSSSGGSGSGTGRGDGVQCQQAKCAVGEVCCVDVTPGGDFALAKCAARGGCSGRFLECDDSSECPAGLVCCANTVGGSAVWISSSCTTSCGDAQLCSDASQCGGNGCVSAPAFVSPKNLRRCEP